MILTSAPARADYVFDGWDDGSLNGWLPATGAADIAVSATNGYSGGFLQSVEQPFTFGIVGAINYGPEYTGDFTAHGYVRMQVATRFLAGSFLSVYFHVRYLDAAHNGWLLPLPADFGDTGWQFFAIDFDPYWSDQEAQAAGWLQEVSTPTFAETMADVYTSGVKATGTGVLSFGMDSFSLGDVSTSTTDMTWGGIKTLYR